MNARAHQAPYQQQQKCIKPMMTTAHAHTHARAHTHPIYIHSNNYSRSVIFTLFVGPCRAIFLWLWKFLLLFPFFPCAPVLWHIFPKFLAFKLLVHSVFFSSFDHSLRSSAPHMCAVLVHPLHREEKKNK